ncbi:MAG: hypothetical protein CL726_09455 [Chloroflexi bacterium]|nr:hypothetical protein [Chloroflexota bacterium]
MDQCTDCRVEELDQARSDLQHQADVNILVLELPMGLGTVAGNCHIGGGRGMDKIQHRRRDGSDCGRPVSPCDPELLHRHEGADHETILPPLACLDAISIIVR